MTTAFRLQATPIAHTHNHGRTVVVDTDRTDKEDSGAIVLSWQNSLIRRRHFALLDHVKMPATTNRILLRACNVMQRGDRRAWASSSSFRHVVNAQY